MTTLERELSEEIKEIIKSWSDLDDLDDDLKECVDQVLSEVRRFTQLNPTWYFKRREE